MRFGQNLSWEPDVSATPCSRFHDGLLWGGLSLRFISKLWIGVVTDPNRELLLWIGVLQIQTNPDVIPPVGTPSRTCGTCVFLRSLDRCCAREARRTRPREALSDSRKPRRWVGGFNSTNSQVGSIIPGIPGVGPFVPLKMPTSTCFFFFLFNGVMSVLEVGSR